MRKQTLLAISIIGLAIRTPAHGASRTFRVELLTRESMGHTFFEMGSALEPNPEQPSLVAGQIESQVGIDADFSKIIAARAWLGLLADIPDYSQFAETFFRDPASFGVSKAHAAHAQDTFRFYDSNAFFRKGLLNSEDLDRVNRTVDRMHSMDNTNTIDVLRALYHGGAAKILEDEAFDVTVNPKIEAIDPAGVRRDFNQLLTDVAPNLRLRRELALKLAAKIQESGTTSSEAVAIFALLEYLFRGGIYQSTRHFWVDPSLNRRAHEKMMSVQGHYHKVYRIEHGILVPLLWPIRQAALQMSPLKSWGEIYNFLSPPQPKKDPTPVRSKFDPSKRHAQLTQQILNLVGGETLPSGHPLATLQDIDDLKKRDVLDNYSVGKMRGELAEIVVFYALADEIVEVNLTLRDGPRYLGEIDAITKDAYVEISAGFLLGKTDQFRALAKRAKSARKKLVLYYDNTERNEAGMRERNHMIGRFIEIALEERIPRDYVTALPIPWDRAIR